MAYVEFDYDAPTFDALLTEALTRIHVTLPGWTPNPAHVEYAVLSEMVRLTLDTRLLATDVADSIFRTYGQKLIGLPPKVGSPATANATFTFTDTSVRTIPAGTQVLWPTGGTPILFQTAADVTNTSGNATTPVVQIAAVENGLAANGLAPATLSLVDALSFVSSVQSTTASAGGTDPETDQQYLGRLTEDLKLLRRIPVLPEDFATLSRDIDGVYRALALDGYNPANGSSNNERMVTVVPLTSAGAEVSSTIKANLDAFLQANREVNFVVNVTAPTFTAITVTFTVQAETGQDTAVVQAAVIQAVKDYLNPAFWGGGEQDPPLWRYEPTVRYLDLAKVVGAVFGVRHVLTLTLNGGTANVTLAGAAPLPAANPTVTGTVS